MVKEALRKCSHCGQYGHNARTCPDVGKSCVKLFGVNISDNGQDESMKRSVSMGNLQSVVELNNVKVEVLDDDDDDACLSDGQVHSKKGKAAHERRKGQPWTQEEHRNFLVGLKKIGKGEWKTIAKAFVKTRNATQVASHAQKYFLRQASSSDKKHRRLSVFDMTYVEPPSTSEDFPSAKTAAASTSSQASALSSAMPVKISYEVPAQANSSDHILNRFPQLCLDPIIPVPSLQSYRGVPCVFRAPRNGQSFPVTSNVPALSYVQAVNYPRPAYVYMPRSIGRVTTCTKVTDHPSGIPSQHASSSGTSQASPTKATEKDSLELKIGPPQSTQRSDISSQPSGAVRVL